MNLQELEILEDDFDLFVALDDHEKIEFLFDATQIGLEASVLKQIAKLDTKYDEMTSPMPTKQIVRSSDFEVGNTRLNVTLTKTEVYLNSNSLKAIRKFANKMFNDGLLLWPSSTKKYIFDMYRYFKAYKIITRGAPISSN